MKSRLTVHFQSPYDSPSARPPMRLSMWSSPLERMRCTSWAKWWDADSRRFTRLIRPRGALRPECLAAVRPRKASLSDIVGVVPPVHLLDSATGIHVGQVSVQVGAMRAVRQVV